MTTWNPDRPTTPQDPPLDGVLGWRFPGGHYRIAPWENFLLTDCTTADQLPDDLAHPIALFHAPILGAGISIETLFAKCGATGPGSVGLDGYDWEYPRALRVDVDYRVEGSIVAWERCVDVEGQPYDAMAFRIELTDPDSGALVARVTNSWRFRRGPDATRARRVEPQTLEDSGSGAALREFVVESVDPQRMKTMAAILRDPYRVHWDRAATEAMGLGGRVINQGPLNLSYVVNALHAHCGVGTIRRLTVAFHRPVFDGDRVVAGGRQMNAGPEGDTWNVWLRRDAPRENECMVSGTAVIGKPESD